MKITDWIAQRWRTLREPGKEELIALSQDLDRACAARDFGTLGVLLQRFRHSEFTTKLIGARMMQGGYPMICSPNDAFRSDVLAMMDALRRTRSVEQFGGSLAVIPAEPYNPLYDLLAMHTFMADACLKHDAPVVNVRRPTPSEVEAATRLLDRWHKEDYTQELTDLIFRHEYPSEYLSLRFGWEKEYRHARHLEMNAATSPDERSFETRRELYEHHELFYAVWERKAEQVLESIPGIALSDRYLAKLNSELEQLAAFVRCPESTNAPNADRRSLAKYGIDPAASHAARVQQSECAFRELDARLVRLTGCRPQSERLFAGSTARVSSLRHSPHPRNDRQPHLKKGCKHSL